MNKTYIIAETLVNHTNNIKLAKKLVLIAKVPDVTLLNFKF